MKKYFSYSEQEFARRFINFECRCFIRCGDKYVKAKCSELAVSVKGAACIQGYTELVHKDVNVYITFIHY